VRHGHGLSLQSIATQGIASRFTLDATAEHIRAAINDPAAYASGGYRLPGLGGARLNASARSSVALQQKVDGTYEYAAHNLTVQSKDYSNAAWIKFASAISAGAIAPDGAASARATMNAGDVSIPLFGTNQTLVSGQTVTWYTVAKYVNNQWLWIRGDRATDTGNMSAAFDLLNGVVGNRQSSLLDHGMAALGGGWYLCWLSQVMATGGASNAVIRCGNGATVISGTITYAGTEAVDLWHSGVCQGLGRPTVVPTTTAAVYAPAVDWLSAQSAYGLRSEAAATNLVTYSADMSNAAWIGGVITRVGNAGVAPDGTSAAARIYPSTSGDYRGVYQQSTQSAAVFTTSVFAKAAGKSWVLFSGTNGTANSGVFFNLATGAIGTQYSGWTGQVEAFANGWYRLTVVHPSQANPYLQLSIVDADASPAVTPNGTDGVLLWGAQLETGSRASSPILTLGATATRAADALVVPGSGWIGATEGSLAATFIASAFPAVGGIFSLNASGSYDNCVDYRAGQQIANAYSAAALVASLGNGVPTAGAVNAVTVAYKANDFAASLNGGAVVADASGAVPVGLNQLRLGALADGQYSINGHLTRIRYIGRRLSDGQLRALTV
jgi:hypothetical protein